MSIERELLNKVISGDNKGDFFISYDLYKEIYEFLVHPEQSEQELVTDKPTETAMAVMPNGVCVSNVYDAYEEGRKSVMVEQEPVAWMWTRNYEGGGYTNKVFEFLNDAEEYAKDSKTLKSPDIIRPLYTAPQNVSLWDWKLWMSAVVKITEKVLKMVLYMQRSVTALEVRNEWSGIIRHIIKIPTIHQLRKDAHLL